MIQSRRRLSSLKKPPPSRSSSFLNPFQQSQQLFNKIANLCTQNNLIQLFSLVKQLHYLHLLTIKQLTLKFQQNVPKKEMILIIEQNEKLKEIINQSKNNNYNTNSNNKGKIMKQKLMKSLQFQNNQLLYEMGKYSGINTKEINQFNQRELQSAVSFTKAFLDMSMKLMNYEENRMVSRYSYREKLKYCWKFIKQLINSFLKKYDQNKQ